MKQFMVQKYGSVRKGSETEEGKQRRVLVNHIKALKLHKEREAFEGLLKDFHKTAALEHMVAELREEEPQFIRSILYNSSSKTANGLPSTSSDRSLTHRLVRSSREWHVSASNAREEASEQQPR